MNMAVVGAARVVFGADTSEFDASAKGVEGVLGRLVEKFHAVEQRIKNIGAGVTLGITVPFAAMTRSIDKGAGSFEANMKKVEAALRGISAGELAELEKQARTLGPSVGKGATEAVAGIEMLARNGLDAAQIMGGALQSSLQLAAAGATELAPAADLVTDVMVQFKRSTADLPAVVQNVVGAMDASKFGFADFQLALSQGGGVAAAAGVNFLDFSTAIAATSAQFSSGSDAGTSFKTYIQSLVGKSKEAERAMNKLGLSFYDAQGRMKPMAEQAEVLRKAYGDLTDEARNKGLEKIFGSDASRTAIGLFETGKEKFEELQRAVAGGDVQARIAKQLEGSEAAGNRIAVAWESVKIALGLETGLLSVTTAIKNGFASMLEAIADAPVSVKRIGAAFAALGAAIGPLLMVLGHLGAILLANFAAAKFGLIGRAIGLMISPVTTLIAILGEYGLGRAIAMIGTRLLALAGPVGWAVGAFVLFKDQIVTALQMVWTGLVETLGPPLEAIFAKVEAMFSRLSGGAIGAAVAGLVGLLGGLKDVIGTALVGAILLAGEIIERTLGAIVAVISGLVDVVSGVVDAVSALLSGDFAGVWNALVGIVESVFATIVGVAAAFVPELGGEMRAAYEAAKTWLADGFSSIVGWFTGAIKGAVDYVAKAFPGVVAAAKSVYEGVKAWLVDAFGGVLSYISGAVRWIVDQYGRVKKSLGLGEAGAPPEAPKPAAPPPPAAAPPAPKRSVSFDDDDDDGGSKRKRKGRDTSHDQQNREQLADQLALDAARLRGDIEAERAIERRLALSRQIEAYQRTGLTLAAATAAAEKDMAALDEARRQGMARDLERDEAAHQIDLARITGNRSLAETLQRQQELKDRIREYLRDGLTLTEATARAARQQLEIDQARAKVRHQLFVDDEQDRQLALARARGDSEERIRQLEREIEIRERSRELEQDFGFTPEQAHAQAVSEAMQAEQARIQGVFRDTIKGGFRAAMDGNFGDWLQNWWKDRIARGMEQALDRLSDAVMNLFAKAGGQSGSGGGILGGLTRIFGGIFGGGGIDVEAARSGANAALDSLNASAPGFKTGGSGIVKGRAGIDANLISIRATAGELVKVERPGNDNGPVGTWMVVPSPYFDVVAAEAAQPSIQSMGVRAAAGGSAMAQAQSAKAARRKIRR